MGLVIASTLPVFPRCPGYGFTAQPGYSVNIVRREGGYERSDRRWARPMNAYSAVPLGPRDEAEVQSVLYFWHAMGGRAETFLIKDWTDYKSCPTYATPAATDAPLVPVARTGGGTAYRLVKDYHVGALHQLREITKPVGATILVANESGAPSDSFRVDENTGLLVPGTGFTGTPTTWGGEFLVPVRFDSELAAQVADRQVQSVQFSLREKRQALSTVFVGGGGSEGITWTDVTPYVYPAFFAKVIHGAGKLLALSAIDCSLFLSSNDGDTWTSVLPFSTSNAAFFPCISFGNGRFVMAGADATSGASIAYTSDDGTTWTARTIDNIGAVNGAVYSTGSNWVATSALFSPSKYATSTDNGATWHQVTTTVVDQFFGNPMYYASGKVVTLGIIGGAQCVLTSTDGGATWVGTTFTDPNFSYDQPAVPLYFDGATFVMGGTNGGTFEPAIITSSTPEGLATAVGQVINGMTAGNSITSVAKVNGVFFAFDHTGAVANSVDGIAWALGSTGTGGDTIPQAQQSLTVDTIANRIIVMLGSNMIRLVVT